MTSVRHLLSGFLAGELSPHLSGRVESEQYRYGLRLCENWLPTIEGPLEKRAGFGFVRPAAPSASWLGAFRRSIDQEYVIEWSEQAARFYTNGGRIETAPGVAYQIATPYAAAEAPALSLQQSFDRLYIAHGAHPPAALRRDTATSFTHEQPMLEGGPFADPNSDEALTLTAGGGTVEVGDSVTLTASAALFEPGHVGAPVRLEARDFGTVPAWEAGMKGVSVGDLVHNEGKVYRADTAGTTGQVQPTHSEGSYYDGQLANDLLNDKGPYGVRWAYVHDRFGLARITAIASATSATATVERRLPDSLAATATWRWSLGALSAAAGWPHLVTIWKGRLILFKDLDILASVVGDYGGGRINFADYSPLGTLTEDLAFRRRIATENPPQWVARDRRLIVGTATHELAIGPVNASAAVSGSNISADDQSFYGSAPVFPVQAGTETIFVERGGTRLRSADFDFARDRYDAADLTAAARHIAGPASAGGFVQLAYQRGVLALLHAVRGDGQLVVHPKSRSEIKGFARMVLGGGARCLSAVAVVGSDNRTDELWLLVERNTAAGVPVREIWKQERAHAAGDPQEAAFYVDGGVRIAAAAGQTLFSGLDHLAGQEVAVLAAGGVVPAMRVSAAGELVLPAASVPADRAFTVVVGLAYRAEAIGLPPEFAMRGTSAQGLKKRLRKLTLRLLEAVGLSVGQHEPGESDGGYLETLIDRPGNAPMDAPIPLVSGDHGREVEAGWETDGAPRWVSAAPLPATVNAAMLVLEVSADDV